MKKFLTASLTILAFFCCATAFAANYSGPPISAKLASEEIEGDFMTVWANNFAEHMKTWSDGKINIEVYPYGTLGAQGDINELAQMGVVQFVFSDHAWISSFVPQAQALALNYIFPTEQVPETLDWVARNGAFLPMMEDAFRKNELVPLAILFEGWQWITSNKEIKTIDDMKGLKLRLMSSKLLVEGYKAYGASPTPMDYGEVYSGLQMGLIDAQVNPLFAIYSMKFYEVQDYVTQLKSEPFIGIPTANQEFFDGLPKEVQDEMRRYWIDAIIPAGQWITERNASDMEKMKADKPSLNFHYIDDEAIKAFKAQAKTVYPIYPQIGGEGADAMLDVLLKDIEDAKKALNIE